MKKISILLLSMLVFAACKNKKNIPDVSDINVQLKWERFDHDFFALDTNDLPNGLNKLQEKNPLITTLFLQNVLGLDSAQYLAGTKRFLQTSRQLEDTVNIVFKNTHPIEKEFTRAFQFIKYYFPQYKVPKIVTIVGPVDALAQSESGPTPDFIRPGILGISLQFYLGKNFSVYSFPFYIENVAPRYRSVRFSKEYIVADAMKLIIPDIFPDKSAGKPLIEQMVEKGKQWYLLDKILPNTADSVKTGYTQQQLDWCHENEGMIWTYIVKNENLQSLSPAVIQNYIGEGPFTPGFPPDYSPGNIGQWIGWQFIKKYVEKNPDIKLDVLMNTDAATIIREAKYKPK